MERIIFHLNEALKLMRELDKEKYKSLNSRYQHLKDFIRLLEADKKKMNN